MSDGCGHHGHGHDHGAGASVGGGKLGLAVGLTVGFVIVEGVAGYFAHSLALLSDAGHNVADAAALAFSWYAVRAAGKRSHGGMTFGYHRVGILAALVNAASLVVIAGVIAVEGVGRFRHPNAVSGWLMIVVASVAIGVNVLISLWLHPGAKHDLNVRSAYLHMVGDAVSAFGVVLAGVVVLLTGWELADPVVSLAIAGLILWSGWGVLKESVGVLLEGTPAGVDMEGVVATIRGVAGVVGVHDLHVWMIGPGAVACCVHVLVGERSVREGQAILRAVAAGLEREHRINHTTVQVEVEGHGGDDLYCNIPGAGHVGHVH